MAGNATSERNIKVVLIVLLIQFAKNRRNLHWASTLSKKTGLILDFWIIFTKRDSGYRITAKLNHSHKTKSQPNHQPIGPIIFARKSAQNKTTSTNAGIDFNQVMAEDSGNGLYGIRWGSKNPPFNINIFISPLESQKPKIARGKPHKPKPIFWA